MAKTKVSDEEIYNEQEEDDVAIPAEPIYNKIGVRSRLSAKYSTLGKATGQLYIWERAGAEVKVDERDVEELLNRKLGKTCCGNPPNILFELVN